MDERVNPDAEPHGISPDEAARAALDGAGAHIAVVDRQGRVVTANAPWRDFAAENGLEGRNGAIGMNYIEIAEAATGDAEEEGRMVATALREVLGGARKEFRHRYPCHSPTTKRWFTLVITPTELAGQPAAVVMHLDITQRYLAEQAAVEAHRASVAAVQARNRFLADLSHEIRTPLNAIVGFTEAMDEAIFGPIENERYADYVGHIRSSASHLIDLLSDTLDNARLEHGAMVLDEDMVELRSAFTLARIVSHGALRARQLGLRITIAPAVERLRLDRRLFVQVMANLITNAAKVSPPEGEIIVDTLLDDDGCPAIRVLDRGPGIPDDMKASVFEPFQRCGPAPFADRGAGLGLSIVNRAILAHGGVITVLDRDGGGTEMRVTLPACRLSQSD